MVLADDEECVGGEEACPADEDGGCGWDAEDDEGDYG
jgi:hypothetical protein